MSKKIRVKQPGKPSLYLLPAGVPAGWRVVGEVDTGRGRGALVRNDQTGIYAMAVGGAMQNLPQREVIATLGGGVTWSKPVDSGAERQARYVASGRAVTVVVRSPEAKEALERLEKLHGGVTAAIEAAVIEADRQEAKALSVSEQMES